MTWSGRQPLWTMERNPSVVNSHIIVLPIAATAFVAGPCLDAGYPNAGPAPGQRAVLAAAVARTKRLPRMQVRLSRFPRVIGHGLPLRDSNDGTRSVRVVPVHHGTRLVH